MLAQELSENVAKINETSSHKIKLVGIGLSTLDLEDFKKEKNFSGPIYINEGKSVYSSLNFKTNSCWNCYGITCKLLKMASKGKEKKITNNLSGDKSQNGGEAAVLKDGTVVFLKLQDDPTDVMTYKDLEYLVTKAKIVLDERKKK
jgi:hypothetical protein